VENDASRSLEFFFMLERLAITFLALEALLPLGTATAPAAGLDIRG
jgi:hypothetical protein